MPLMELAGSPLGRSNRWRMSLEDEISELIERRVQADPLLLEAMVVEGEGHVSGLDAARLALRVLEIHNEVIFRLAREIDELTG